MEAASFSYTCVIFKSIGDVKTDVHNDSRVLTFCFIFASVTRGWGGLKYLKCHLVETWGESSGLSSRLSLLGAAGASAVCAGQLSWPVHLLTPPHPLAQPKPCPTVREGGSKDQVTLSQQKLYLKRERAPLPCLRGLLPCDVMLYGEQQKRWSGLADSWCDACVRELASSSFFPLPSTSCHSSQAKGLMPRLSLWQHTVVRSSNPPAQENIRSSQTIQTNNAKIDQQFR